MPIPPDSSRGNHRNARAVDRVVQRIELELEEIKALLECGPGQRERINLKAEQAHLRNLRRQLRRKPPESGIAVPAIPPNGPLPLEGGAEAPLEFD